MNILGLDMSSKKSGYSYFIDEKLIEYGLWEMTYETEHDWRERIKWMSNKLHSFCQEHKIDKIFVEDVPPTLDNSQTVKVLSALQGCVITIANINNINVEFISVPTWKNIIGIDTTHSKENKAIQKKCKLENKNMLKILKTNIKNNEKKMSVDYANKLFGIDLIYKSPSSKFNMDDISDSINIVVSQIFENPPKYDIDTIENIVEDIYNNIKNKKMNRFGKTE